MNLCIYIVFANDKIKLLNILFDIMGIVKINDRRGNNNSKSSKITPNSFSWTSLSRKNSNATCYILNISKD